MQPESAAARSTRRSWPAIAFSRRFSGRVEVCEEVSGVFYPGRKSRQIGISGAICPLYRSAMLDQAPALPNEVARFQASTRAGAVIVAIAPSPWRTQMLNMPAAPRRHAGMPRQPRNSAQRRRDARGTLPRSGARRGWTRSAPSANGWVSTSVGAVLLTASPHRRHGRSSAAPAMSVIDHSGFAGISIHRRRVRPGMPPGEAH